MSFSEKQSRLWIILGLGFAAGLPLGLSGATLQAWYTTEGLDLKVIGLLTLVGQPYVLKFLWAPAVDKVRFPWLSVRRDWMVLTQLLLVGLLVAMAFFEPRCSPMGLALVALALACASATQDIAIDAYRTELLKVEERGLGSALYVTGYRIAMVVSGGLALFLAAYFGFSMVYGTMALLMGLIVLMTWFAPAVPTQGHQTILSWSEVIVLPWKAWFSQKNASLILVFIVLYKLSDAFANSLSTTFLLRGMHFTLGQVAWLNKVVVLGATILGAFLGGILLTRWSLYRALMVFGILQGVTNGGYGLLAAIGEPHTAWAGVIIFTEHLCSGMGTSAFMALLMSLCQPQFAATQFALLTALSAVGRVWVGPAASYTILALGWQRFFLISMILCLPALYLLKRLKVSLGKKI